MKFILVTWLLVNGAPKYQYSKPLPDETACQSLWQALEKSGAKVDGYYCMSVAKDK